MYFENQISCATNSRTFHAIVYALIKINNLFKTSKVKQKLWLIVASAPDANKVENRHLKTWNTIQRMTGLQRFQDSALIEIHRHFYLATRPVNYPTLSTRERSIIFFPAFSWSSCGNVEILTLHLNQSAENSVFFIHNESLDFN